jgi:MoaA/NifB/PqqE/SkfB family radical SAM enzyme
VVFFGGLGEPLFHPRTTEWVKQVKELRGRVELITNGTMLTEKKARQLIDAGLDVLWVSIDGATPESYSDVRLGAELPNVVTNVRRFANLRKPSHRPVPAIGIAFVAMKRNFHELPQVLKLGRRLKALYFSVSNVLPYTPDLDQDRLYSHTLKNIAYMPSPWLSHLNIPKMDFDEQTQETLFKAFNSGYNVTFAGNNLGGANDVCNFIESGSMSVGWQGDVAPCLPLLHTHTSYLHGKPRLNHKHVIGNVAQRDLLDLWLDPEYIIYRERVQRFAFAPCTFCGGCEMAEANQEDCFTNVHPACGGCLWAQGVIQCP